MRRQAQSAFDVLGVSALPEPLEHSTLLGVSALPAPLQHSTLANDAIIALEQYSNPSIRRFPQATAGFRPVTRRPVTRGQRFSIATLPDTGTMPQSSFDDAVVALKTDALRLRSIRRVIMGRLRIVDHSMGRLRFCFGICVAESASEID